MSFIYFKGTLAPQALKSIAKELQSLERSPPEDVQVIQGEQDLTEIQAWIRGPGNIEYGVLDVFEARILISRISIDAQTAHLMRTVTLRSVYYSLMDILKYHPKVNGG